MGTIQRVTLILVLLLCAMQLHAQNYARYYRQTALAEECLRNGQLGNALQHYDSAFVGYDFKFAKDCYIAGQIAAYLDSNKRAFAYLGSGLTAGIKLDCLKKQRVLDNFWKTEYGRLLQANQGKYSANYVRRIDTTLCKEWTKRHLDEQKVKGKGEIYVKTVDDNVKAISLLLNKGIFPGERLIGVDNSLPIAFIGSSRPGDTCYYDGSRAIPTLKHYKHSYEVFKSKLVAAMLAGYLHPYELLSTFVFNNNNVSKVEITTRYPKEIDLATSKEGNLLFHVSFEQGVTSSDEASANRYNWYIPRPGKYSAEDIQSRFGIDIMVGDWIE